MRGIIMNHILLYLLYSLVAGLATTIGSIIVLAFRYPSKKQMSLYLGFAAGIMIGVSVFELLPHGIQLSNIFYAAGGFVLGCILMWLLDHFLSRTSYSQSSFKYQKLGYYIALGIGAHNLPEGLAIGAGFSATPTLGLIVALSIGLHNIPEGMSIAMPLKVHGVNWKRIILITTLAGLTTPFGTLVGTLVGNISSTVITLALGMAAGSMIYISSDELIPESHHCHSHMANLGILSGFLLMLILSYV